MTRRRWIADEVNLAQNTASLTGANARHLATVLRAKVGQQFDITLPGSDGDSVYAGKIISIADDRVTFALSDPTAPQPGQLREVDLLLAVFKFDRMEWVIEKCTELGASRFIPVVAHRTETHLAAAAQKRVERWRRIALFAAVGLTCAFEMRNYVVMAVEYPLYELVSPELMRGLKILKSPADVK